MNKKKYLNKLLNPSEERNLFCLYLYKKPCHQVKPHKNYKRNLSVWGSSWVYSHCSPYLYHALTLTEHEKIFILGSTNLYVVYISHPFFILCSGGHYQPEVLNKKLNNWQADWQPQNLICFYHPLNYKILRSTSKILTCLKLTSVRSCLPILTSCSEAVFSPLPSFYLAIAIK